MNSQFNNLDHERGTLRLLLILYLSEEELTRNVLREKLQEHGVGKTAFYSSLNTCLSLNLITEKRIQQDNVSIKTTQLTEKGTNIAQTIKQLHDQLESN